MEMTQSAEKNTGFFIYFFFLISQQILRPNPALKIPVCTGMCGALLVGLVLTDVEQEALGAVLP